MSSPISWVGAGRMAAGIQETPDLYGLPFQIPASPIRYFLRRARPGARQTSSNVQVLIVFRVPTQGTYGGQVNRIIDYAWAYSHQAGGRRAPSFSTTVVTNNPKLQNAPVEGARIIRCSARERERWRLCLVRLETNIVVREVLF